MSFPGGSAGKETACNAGDPGLIAGLGRSTEGNGNSLQYSFLGKSHGQRSLAGYSPDRDGKELVYDLVTKPPPWNTLSHSVSVFAGGDWANHYHMP